jgi:hypothetical protein
MEKYSVNIFKEPFWMIYAQHKTEEIMEMLEELRIGSLADSDLQRSKQQQMVRIFSRI